MLGATPAGMSLPLLRAVHRRVPTPVNETKATIDALVDQSNADHNYLSELRAAVISIHKHYASLEARHSAVKKEIKHWQK